MRTVRTGRQKPKSESLGSNKNCGIDDKTYLFFGLPQRIQSEGLQGKRALWAVIFRLGLREESIKCTRTFKKKKAISISDDHKLHRVKNLLTQNTLKC